MRFAIFLLHLSKVLCLPRNVMPSHTKCTCHAKSSSQTWRSDAPKCKPSQKIRRPRPSPRPGRRLGPPQVWNLSCRTTLQNLPNPPNPPKPSKPSGRSPKPSKPSKHLVQQAPQGQGHFPNRHPRAKATAMAFYGLSKLPFASPQTLQTLQNPPNAPKSSKPSKHPPKPSKPPKPPKPSKPSLQTLQNFQTLQNPPNPPNTLQNPPNPPNPPKPSKPSTPFKTLQTLQNPPNPPNTFPNRHPRAKATSESGTPGPRPQQWLSIGFQTIQNPPNPPKPSKPSTPFKPSKPSKTLQTLQTPSPTGTPGPRPLLNQDCLPLSIYLSIYPSIHPSIHLSLSLSLSLSVSLSLSPHSAPQIEGGRRHLGASPFYKRPDLLTSLMNMSLVLRLPRQIHLCRSSSNVPRPPSFLQMPQNPHVLLTFGRVENFLRLPHKTTLQRPKVARTCGVLCIFTSTCASRHNSVHFFIISTSKNGPSLVCSVHFDLDMCFEPQRPATFHLSWPHGSAPAASASLLFDPPEPQIMEKNTVFCDFPTFSRAWIFFLLGLSLVWSSFFFSSLLWLFPPVLFHLSILSEVWLLNFLR